MKKPQHIPPRIKPKLPVFPFNIAAATAAVTAIGMLHHEMQYNLPNLYTKLSPNVVTVQSISIHRDPFSPSDMIESIDSIGTGFSFIGKDYIITNAHVVQDSFNIKIKTHDHEYNVQKIGEDSINDIAILELPSNNSALNLTPLKKCPISPPEIGSSVFAIGNPFGLDQTITSGIISGINRSLETAKTTPNLLQTDAAINPGNSGGPLFDAKTGCLLGMNTSILSPNGANVGIGFAIPIDKIEEIANNIINHIQPDRLQLGITLLPDEYANMLEINGVIIADILPDSIAEKIGLIGTYRDENGRPMLGDIIIGINEKTIKTHKDLYSILDTLRSIDKSIILKVVRKDGIFIIDLKKI
jgi:S1-C subfamily serine protease